MFTAIPVEDSLSKKLAQVRTDLKGAQWVSPEQFHITLVFMGDVNVYLYRQIRQQLKAIDFKSFEIKVEGIELFYDAQGEPTVLYAKVHESEEIKALQLELANLISMFHPNLKLVHSFHPHITLARLHKTPKEEVEQFVSYFRNHECCKTEVKEFNLYSSRTTPIGSVYTKLESYESIPKEELDYSDYQIF